MNGVVQNFSDLTDSRELLESKPFPMGMYFTYLIISLLVIVFVWASFSNLDVVVKANGVVRPIEKVSTIKNTVEGKLAVINFENGDKIKAGDIIFQINSENLILLQDGITSQTVSLEEEIKLLELFKKSISDKINYFDIELGNIDENYYYKYQKYELDLLIVDENIIYLESNIKLTLSKIDDLEILLYSIVNKKSEFSSSDLDSKQYQNYKSYLLNINDLQMSIKDLKISFESNKILYEQGNISKQDYETSKLKYDQFENKLKKYISDTKLSIKNQIEILNQNLMDYESQLRKSVPEQIGINKSIFETEMMINLNNEIQNYKLELEKLYKNNRTLTLNIEDTVIKAPIDGYINYNNEFTIGDFINLGTNIGTIVPENGDSFKIQIYILNKDISNIEIGDNVKYRFEALPYKEYGVLEGKITKISVDTKYNLEQNQSYYLVESTVKNQQLLSYKGNKANIKVGMVLEAQVITKTKKVLFYLLEKMDLWNN